jgi:predicted DNA-binding protein
MSRQLKKSVATSTQVIEEILKNYANETELLHLRNEFLRTKKEGSMRFHSRACQSVLIM